MTSKSQRDLMTWEVRTSTVPCLAWLAMMFSVVVFVLAEYFPSCIQAVHECLEEWSGVQRLEWRVGNAVVGVTSWQRSTFEVPGTSIDCVWDDEPTEGDAD